MVRLGEVVIGVCWLAACDGGGPMTHSQPGFSYNGSQPFPAVVGEAIALTPAASGPIERYAVSPELPAGLTLNGSTGVISGTPTRSSGPAVFVVTASYPGGRSTFSLVLSVTEPPSHLSYPSPAQGIVGSTLTPLTPTVTGTVAHFAVTPALPAGVMLDSTSGLIAGTPTIARALTAYTITASSQAGSTNFVLLLTVAAPASASR